MHSPANQHKHQGSEQEEPTFITQRARRYSKASRDGTPDKSNPNEGDIFLPKHKPIHIDPTTKRYFEEGADGQRIYVSKEALLAGTHKQQENLEETAHFGQPDDSQTQMAEPESPSFVSEPSPQNSASKSPAAAQNKAGGGKGQGTQGAGSAGGSPANYASALPNDPCP